jgi:hypothetical protein
MEILIIAEITRSKDEIASSLSFLAMTKKGSHQQDWWATRVRVERIIIRPYRFTLPPYPYLLLLRLRSGQAPGGGNEGFHFISSKMVLINSFVCVKY